ncbi:hypothetical protein [Halobacillus litoralis]|uniref:hypothetical protein n=1 Tax=Halobacillus litoralis TaxID=45668 RepID=UPI00136CE851|nr:hypothetical protein [Halobacillus litoralis]MYL37887.1 hypothetical protein [Halobacillus litoralis]
MHVNHLFSYLFSSKKTLLYTTFLRKDYFRAAAVLTQSGVDYRTAVIHHKPVIREVPGSDGLTSEYRFYVRKNDYHQADSMVSSQI